MPIIRFLRYRCCGSTQDLCIPGDDGALGCAAATLTVSTGPHESYDEVCAVREMTGGPRPTPDRAGVMAVVLALSHALGAVERALSERSLSLQEFDDNRDNRDYSRLGRATVEIHILSDSEYAIHGLRSWVPQWRRSGFLGPAANPDLWTDIMDLEEELDDIADVEYTYVPVNHTHIKMAHEVCRGNIEEQFQVLAHRVSRA